LSTTRLFLLPSRCTSNSVRECTRLQQREGHVQPMRFYLKGILGLVILFLVTLTMVSAPEVNALRAMIVGGLVIVAGKMIVVRYNVKWPPRQS
jgi:hypothetical protein